MSRYEKRGVGREDDTLVSVNALASLYLSMGRNDEALPLNTKCLALRKEVLGEIHPDTLESLNRHILIYDNMGQHDDSLPLKAKYSALKAKLQKEKSKSDYVVLKLYVIYIIHNVLTIHNVSSCTNYI